MGWGHRVISTALALLGLFFFPPSKMFQNGPFLRLNSPCRRTRRNDHPSSRSLADVRSLLSSRQRREAVNPKQWILDYRHLVSLIFPLLMDNRDIHRPIAISSHPDGFQSGCVTRIFYHNSCARCYQLNSASSRLFGGRGIQPIS